jgi:ferredoxin-NADP reductase
MKLTLDWQIATIKAIKQETPRVKTFTLTLANQMRHQASQHYDIRLTAPDGYQAQRSYSIASEPERTGEIDLTVERIEDGEVSTYLHDVLVIDDRLEVRGPVGGYFVWDAGPMNPVLLIAGGSGIVPLMAMIRHRCAAGSQATFRLLYSSRSAEDIIYARELDQLQRSHVGLEVFHTLTRIRPPGWIGFARRIDLEMLREVVTPVENGQLRIYICGPTSLVEAAANGLVSLGIPGSQIRTERFGPTGGPA